jgi:hypothetical protein
VGALGKPGREAAGEFDAAIGDALERVPAWRLPMAEINRSMAAWRSAAGSVLVVGTRLGCVGCPMGLEGFFKIAVPAIPVTKSVWICCPAN